MRIARFLASAAMLFVFSVAPASSQTPVAQTPAAKPKAATTTTAKPAAATYDRSLLKPAILKDKAPDTYQVKFETTRGDFTVTVTRAWAPFGADRFYNLVKHHYFDNARVFRVVPNFVAQFGLSAYPAVNTAWRNAKIKDDPRNQGNKKGTIVFATSGPNTRTTQLFINMKDNSFLDSQGFTPFGAVDGNGLNVVGMFYDQYGDNAGVNDQENIDKGGEKYIATKWPKLDTLKKVSLVGEPAAAPTAKPAAKPAPKPATPKPAPKPQQ
jgi:peptidyl-prolyl cis-trans isomerase A (cyclophilin A)